MKRKGGEKKGRTSTSTTPGAASAVVRTSEHTTRLDVNGGASGTGRNTTRPRVVHAITASRAKRAALSREKELEALRLNQAVERQRYGARAVLPVLDGCVFVVSDQHYYPGLKPSKAHMASLQLAEMLKPYAIISNGDAIDGASISRWPVSSFVEMKGRPTVAAELGEATARLKEYEALASPKYLVWNLGNHDARFETRLAEKVPEYQGVDGFTLKERYPAWIPAWRTDFRAKPDGAPLVIVKHRSKGGMHAGQNNVLWSGTSFVTGHDHMLKAYAISNAHGLQWGVHAGTMAPVDSPFFTHYTEDNVVNWQQGFAILHFQGGRFMGPELVHVTPDGVVLFRGKALR